MAETRPKSFTASVYKGSEEVVDCPCTPCAREGAAIEAVNFCTDCSEFFCLGCTKHHVKFGMTASHNVVDRTEADRGKKSPAQQLPTERCRDHNGELVTSYCRDHDVVVCNSCATMDHRSCDSMAYIPKISGDSSTREAVPRVKAEVSASLIATRAARLHVQKHKAVIDEEKAKQQTTIKASTERLIAHARDLEEAALDDATRHHEEAAAKITAELAQLDDTEAALEKRQRSLDNTQTTCDSQVFVDTKLGSREAAVAMQLEQRLTSTGTGNVRTTFMLDGSVNGFLSDANYLGKVVVNKPYKATHKGTYDVKQFLKDDATCGICDSCELPNGNILMTDYDNVCIKAMDTSYKIVKRFKMPSAPWGICQTSPSEIAVTLTLDRKVQFVDMGGSWKLATSFPVQDGCRGITYSKGELLVACGGYPGTDDPEGPGFVAIHSLSGYMHRKIKLDTNGRLIFIQPFHIITTNNGENIHVADGKDGVTTLDRQGNVLSTFSEHIERALGLCTIDDFTLIVCGRYSDNVLQIAATGELVAELLNEQDGMKEPRCVVYSRSNSTLIVMCEASNKIKVFTLNS